MRGTLSKNSVRFILLNHKNINNNFIDEDLFNGTVKLLNDIEMNKINYYK